MTKKSNPARNDQPMGQAVDPVPSAVLAATEAYHKAVCVFTGLFIGTPVLPVPIHISVGDVTFSRGMDGDIWCEVKAGGPEGAKANAYMSDELATISGAYTAAAIAQAMNKTREVAEMTATNRGGTADV